MTDTINDLASDIREVDGEHKLGASELAEKLIEKGWAKTSPKNDASVDYPHLDSTGETIVLGPGVFVSTDESVLNWKGTNYVPQAQKDSQPPLSSYRVDELVEAVKNGAWLPGRISSIDKGSHWLHVQTERGPVTIASQQLVRKLK